MEQRQDQMGLNTYTGNVIAAMNGSLYAPTAQRPTLDSSSECPKN